jgi:hypothetical protein
MEVGRWKWEDGSGKMEVGRWKLEVGRHEVIFRWCIMINKSFK